MNFKIETKEAFRIVGKSCPLSKVLEENFARIPYEWDTALENGTLSKLYELMNDKPEGLLGVSVHNEKEWKYFIAVSSAENSDSFEQYDIPVATWAIFSGRGTNVSLQDLERRVITEWLPTSGYEYAEIPDIEVYIKADPKDAIMNIGYRLLRRRIIVAVSTIKAEFQREVEKVWELVTSLDKYSWRSDLDKIVVTVPEKEFEEHTKDGYVTRFKITAFDEYKNYEFDMENDNMHGHWTGKFSYKDGITIIEFTENVNAKKLIMKPFVGSYLKKQQEKYIQDLRNALEAKR